MATADTDYNPGQLVCQLREQLNMIDFAIADTTSSENFDGKENVRIRKLQALERNRESIDNEVRSLEAAMSMYADMSANVLAQVEIKNMHKKHAAEDITCRKWGSNTPPYWNANVQTDAQTQAPPRTTTWRPPKRKCGAADGLRDSERIWVNHPMEVLVSKLADAQAHYDRVRASTPDSVCESKCAQDAVSRAFFHVSKFTRVIEHKQLLDAQYMVAVQNATVVERFPDASAPSPPQPAPPPSSEDPLRTEQTRLERGIVAQPALESEPEPKVDQWEETEKTDFATDSALSEADWAARDRNAVLRHYYATTNHFIRLTDKQFGMVNEAMAVRVRMRMLKRVLDAKRKAEEVANGKKEEAPDAMDVDTVDTQPYHGRRGITFPVGSPIDTRVKAHQNRVICKFDAAHMDTGEPADACAWPTITTKKQTGAPPVAKSRRQCYLDMQHKFI